MAFADMAHLTPSPPSSIRTPPTPPAPRFGFHDNWEPYFPRKSARISAQRAAARTPSPPPNYQSLGSPRTAKKANTQSSAAMVSPVTSPRKKRQPAADSVRRASDNPFATSDIKNKPADKSRVSAVGMLPTPSKTPQKPPNAKAVANIRSFARNLFPPEETAVSSPRKKRAKKYSGITMESFEAEEVEQPIEIFTDSQDRVPKKDESESNPFYGNITRTESPKRRSGKYKVLIPGEGLQSIEEASSREDGIVYVFRGRKFFRKFSEFDDDDEELDSDVEAEFPRPLTRSSIKPRLLFPTHKSKKTLEEEEAATDVEDLDMKGTLINPQTPVKVKAGRAQTPEAPKFAPVSPPDTKRTTRSRNKMAESTPMKRTEKKSPFDAWRRTKEHNIPAGTKRAGDSMASPSAKRART